MKFRRLWCPKNVQLLFARWSYYRPAKTSFHFLLPSSQNNDERGHLRQGPLHLRKQRRNKNTGRNGSFQWQALFGNFFRLKERRAAAESSNGVHSFQTLAQIRNIHQLLGFYDQLIMIKINQLSTQRYWEFIFFL